MSLGATTLPQSGLAAGATASTAAVPGTPAPVLVRLQGAGVRFGAVQALRDITLELRRGERLVLVGANGSGKTTLLRLLNGLVAPSTGRREAPLAVAGGAPPVSAMLFQRPFMMNLSVRRNLALALIPFLTNCPRGSHPNAAFRVTDVLTPGTFKTG
jgi:ABC-type nitrate/sulfonate/bicarbonate transport system ATPase subunit